MYRLDVMKFLVLISFVLQSIILPEVAFAIQVKKKEYGR